MQYHITNTEDGNNVIDIEAENDLDAARKALFILGWSLSVGHSPEDEEE